MNQRTTLLIAAAFGFTAVVLGAFGAHALKPMLVERGRFDVYELATRYQFYHTFALLAAGILQHWYRAKALRYAALSFTIGTVLFSGSLYALCFTTLTFFGPITPLGGVFLIFGWAALFLAIFQSRK
jgi:uncharacterized membrane protein YgdD (TMEM256/DUF423 family)